MTGPDPLITLDNGVCGGPDPETVDTRLFPFTVED